MNLRHLILSLLIVSLLAACRQAQPSASDIQLELAVSDRRVGETTLLVTARDAEGAVIAEPGALSLRGDMKHAGMVPVFAEAETAIAGVFALPFEWTMGGSWIVEAALTLPNGEVARQTFNVEILTEADGMTDMDHSDMDQAGGMSEMEHADRAGETSAVYMRIYNRGEADITLVAAASSAAASAEFHQTVIENDMARMEALNGLLIPAGETLELAPGGAHIMLMDLQSDLLPESQMPLRLTCDSGEVYELAVSVLPMRRDELGDAVAIGDLVFENRWARPASAGMRHDEMDMDAAASE